MTLEDHELHPATVLRGHLDQDTAYLVEDYPYGFTLRCRIRYWLHTAPAPAPTPRTGCGQLVPAPSSATA